MFNCVLENITWKSLDFKITLKREKLIGGDCEKGFKALTTIFKHKL